jgi:hypothetical protein
MEAYVGAWFFSDNPDFYPGGQSRRLQLRHDHRRLAAPLVLSGRFARFASVNVAKA